MALDRINDGDWLHIFPEGTRSEDGVLLPLKPGVGRIISEANTAPIVVPFYHLGMGDILRKGEKKLGLNKHVHVIVGDPIDFDDILDEHYEHETLRYVAITTRISERLQQLQLRLQQRIDAECDV